MNIPPKTPHEGGHGVNSQAEKVTQVLHTAGVVETR